LGAVSIHDGVKDDLKERCEGEMYDMKTVVTTLVRKFCNEEIEVEKLK